MEFIDWIIYGLAFLAIFVAITVLVIIRKRKKRNNVITTENQMTIQKIQDQINSVTSSLNNLPRSNEVDLISEKLSSIEQNFENLNENVIMKQVSIDDKVSSMNREYSEKLSDVEKKILNETTKKILEKATIHISETSVNKEEFDRLKSRIENLIGAEIDAKRLHSLNMIFGDTERKDVLSWKCKTITLLKGGLAPQAEEDVLVSEGISLPKAKKFLKDLFDMGIVEQKKIESYWLNDDFQWLHKYMDDVELLIHRIKQTVRNEKNYEKYIKENFDQIEEGLIFEHEQYSFNDENIVDLVCVDKNGTKLFIELKYPLAKATDKFQLVRYREVYNNQGGSARFLLIAPSIPSIMQETLKSDDLEFREISF